jgi:hypothetical protein
LATESPGRFERVLQTELETSHLAVPHRSDENIVYPLRGVAFPVLGHEMEKSALFRRWLTELDGFVRD